MLDSAYSLVLRTVWLPTEPKCSIDTLRVLQQGEQGVFRWFQFVIAITRTKSLHHMYNKIIKKLEIQSTVEPSSTKAIPPSRSTFHNPLCRHRGKQVISVKAGVLESLMQSYTFSIAQMQH